MPIKKKKGGFFEMKVIDNNTSFLILFVLGLLTGLTLYWLVDISTELRAENPSTSFRVLASRSPDSDCSQIKDISSKENLDIYCSITTTEQDRGVSYRVRSTIEVKKDPKKNKAIISVVSKIRDKKQHLTEADYCDNCVQQRTVALDELDNINDLSQVVQIQIENALNQSRDHIEEAVDTAYEQHQEKKKLRAQIARCEISPKSTLDDTIEITAVEKIKCRKKQISHISNSRERTRFFHSTVKKDLWYLAQQDQPLDSDFFLSNHIQELNSPDLFNHDYFSVRSAIDTVTKYNDLRLFMHELGDHKIKALDSISNQLPYYFHTNDNHYGREDRRYLESAWNKNFPERAFPEYYSLTASNTKKEYSHQRGMSAQQFRAIVNSPEFQRLYHP